MSRVAWWAYSAAMWCVNAVICFGIAIAVGLYRWEQGRKS